MLVSELSVAVSCLAKSNLARIVSGRFGDCDGPQLSAGGRPIDRLNDELTASGLPALSGSSLSLSSINFGAQYLARRAPSRAGAFEICQRLGNGQSISPRSHGCRPDNGRCRTRRVAWPMCRALAGRSTRLERCANTILQVQAAAGTSRIAAAAADLLSCKRLISHSIIVGAHLGRATQVAPNRWRFWVLEKVLQLPALIENWARFWAHRAAAHFPFLTPSGRPMLFKVGRPAHDTIGRRATTTGGRRRFEWAACVWCT